MAVATSAPAFAGTTACTIAVGSQSGDFAQTVGGVNYSGPSLNSTTWVYDETAYTFTNTGDTTLGPITGTITVSGSPTAGWDSVTYPPDLHVVGLTGTYDASNVSGTANGTTFTFTIASIAPGQTVAFMLELADIFPTITLETAEEFYATDTSQAPLDVSTLAATVDVVGAGSCQPASPQLVTYTISGGGGS